MGKPFAGIKLKVQDVIANYQANVGGSRQKCYPNYLVSEILRVSRNNKVLDGASMNLIVMHVGDIHVQQYGLSLLLAAHPFDTDLVYLG